MISKAITWGKDRTAAMDLLNIALDEYVIEGVANNLGFGKSILENANFRAGDYDTSFIPTFYPNGYAGNTLNSTDK
jgi:acetyl/propionyl-CoA carboxylase alpha subunit